MAVRTTGQWKTAVICLETAPKQADSSGLLTTRIVLPGKGNGHESGRKGTPESLSGRLVGKKYVDTEEDLWIIIVTESTRSNVSPISVASD